MRRGLSWHNCQRAFYCRRYGHAILKLIRDADATEFIKLRLSATARQFRYENLRSAIIFEGTERKNGAESKTHGILHEMRAFSLASERLRLCTYSYAGSGNNATLA